MKTPRLTLSLLFAACLGISGHASAQTLLYSDNFEVDSSANWSVYQGSGTGVSDYTAQFAFTYTNVSYVKNGVTNKIPVAPNGTGVKGVKLTVNKNDATADPSGVSIYPTGQVFSNDFSLKFDIWINYAGGVQGAGGVGTTEFAQFGINSSATHVNWDDGTAISDGIWFGVTGEAGAANDWRAYAGDNASPRISLPPVDGGFLDRNFDGLITTADQEVFAEANTNLFKMMFPMPTFETDGVPGKQWVQGEVRQRTNTDGSHTVTWLMNGYAIASNSFGEQLGQTMGDVMLGTMDIFSSVGTADNFVIYDNVRVVDLTGVDPLPIVEVTATDSIAAEPGGSTGLGTDTGTFTISRTGSTAAPLTVNYRMAGGGTASNGVDYVLLNGVATIPAGASSTDVTLTVTNDAKSELPEFAIMMLAGSTNYDIYNNASATVTINDDGDVPNANITSGPIWSLEPKTGRVGQFTIALTTPFTSDVSVNYTIGGTATNGVNYNTISSPALIPAGQSNVVIQIVPINDSFATPSNLTVNLTLTSGANYFLGTTTNATVTIANDDLPVAPLLFSDSFETDTSANWNTNASLTNCDALFAFDYSSVSIPPAPHTIGGTTRGLRFRANSPVLGAAVFSGISASPKNQNFTGDYRLRFDWWINFPGPFPGGGAGSTECASFGITRGTIPQWAGGVATTDSAYIAISGDGGSSQDYRCYTNSGASLIPASGVYSGGTGSTIQDSGNSYYSIFGLQAAPSGQAPATQTGLVQAGGMGETWHDAVMTKRGSVVTWSVDGVPIATINATNLNLSTNIFVGHFDINGTQTTVALDPLNFSLVDNLVVEDLTLAITGTQIINGGTQVQIDFKGGGLSTFSLLSSSTVNGVYTPIVVTPTSTGTGTYRFVTAVNGDQRFFKIQGN